MNQNANKIIKVFPQYRVALIVPLKCGSRSVMRAIKDSRVSWEAWTPEQIARDGEGYKKFGVIRNPHARLISFWAGNINKPKIHPTFEALGFTAEMPFEYALDVIAANTRANPHYSPQWDILTGAGRYGCSLLPFDRLRHGWERVRRYVDVLGELKHINASEHLRYSEYYGEAQYNRVAELYRKDIELLLLENLFKCA